MYVINEEGSRPIKAWTHDIEESALKQTKNLARMPFISGHGLALMPDCHAGIGSTVGTVIATEKAIIPAAVGVDIGCGMSAIRTSLTASDLPDSLKELRNQIERDVPTGMNDHRGALIVEANRIEMCSDLQMSAPLYRALAHVFRKDSDDESGIETQVYKKAAPQVGTLGGGNHFIELCLDEEQRVWVMLHSGSRGIGNMIGRAFIGLAQRDMERYFITLPDKDLAYLPEGSAHYEEYVAVVDWAQQYAFLNRKVMMQSVLAAMKRRIPVEFTLEDEGIACHHNYIAKESHFGKNLWITRKGAIRAREGDLGIIPGSMGQKSYIVCGKGHLESYCSCSHGAGRRMSRTQARNTFTKEDLEAQTQGVECRKDGGVIDEIPGAYKDIDEVMANQADLVSIKHTLKQVLCVKG